MPGTGRPRPDSSLLAMSKLFVSGVYFMNVCGIAQHSVSQLNCRHRSKIRNAANVRKLGKTRSRFKLELWSTIPSGSGTRIAADDFQFGDCCGASRQC